MAKGRIILGADLDISIRGMTLSSQSGQSGLVNVVVSKLVAVDSSCISR